jgi:hypothetical protein
MIIGLIPNEPASNYGKLAVGVVIESVDDMSIASMSQVPQVEMRGHLFKGQPGSMITLYIHSRCVSNADRITTMPLPPPGEIYTETYVCFNRGPRVGIQCEKIGLSAMIIGLIPNEPATNCGELDDGDVIELVDDMSIASMSQVEMRGHLFQGHPGYMITLYIHSRCVSNADRITTMLQARASDDTNL